jgi:hypothetical protein
MNVEADVVFFVRCSVGRELTEFETALVREIATGRHPGVDSSAVTIAAHRFVKLKRDVKNAILAEKEARCRLDDMLRSSLVECSAPWGAGGCGAKFAVGELQYRQTYWYDKGGPYESGYWTQGEGQWRCPKCDFVVRLCSRHQWIEQLKSLFASVVEVKTR